MPSLDLKRISSRKSILSAAKTDFFYIGTLFLIGLISYVQILKMYFWLDDYTYLYYAQFQEPQSVFQFPYQFGLILARLLFPLFGLTAYWYYLLGIIFFLSAAILVYLLAVMIFEKKLLAFFATAIFASGYIGQGSLFMVVGDGLYVLLGLDALLITLINFLKYLKSKRALNLTYAVLAFAVCLEIAPTRFAGLLPIIIAADFILGKDNFKEKIKRIILFGTVFYLQYIVHPTRLLFFYGSTRTPSSPDNFSFLISQFHPAELINIFGSFGNLFVPTYFRINNNYFWAYAVLLFFLNLGLLILFKFLRPKAFSFKKIWLGLVPLFGLSLMFYLISAKLPLPVYRFSIINGLMVLDIFATSLILNLPNNRRIGLFLIIFALCLLSIFSVVKPTIVIDSDHRYLLPEAIIPSLMLYLLAPKELIKPIKNSQKAVAWIIFLSPITLLVITHLFLAVTTQAKFISQYTNFRQKYFQEMKSNIPKIDKKTVIYTEGSTRQMDFVLGDVQRVGTLGPEASYAVNYRTKMDNIILPSDTSAILKLIKESQISLNQVYTFIYNDDNLINTSQVSRELFKNPTQSISLSPLWSIEPPGSLVDSNGAFIRAKTYFFSTSKGTLGVYPKIFFSNQNNINSQLPIRLLFKMKADLIQPPNFPYYQLNNSNNLVRKEAWPETLDWRELQCRHGFGDQPFDCLTNQKNFGQQIDRLGKIEITWKYDSFGLLSKNKQADFSVPLDGAEHQYQLVIPSGGQYLKQIIVNYVSFPGDLSIEFSKMSYIN